MSMTIRQLVDNILTTNITELLESNGVDIDAQIEFEVARAGFASEAVMDEDEKSEVAYTVAWTLIGSAKAALVGSVKKAEAGPAKAEFEDRLKFLESLERTIAGSMICDTSGAGPVTVTCSKTPAACGSQSETTYWWDYC